VPAFTLLGEPLALDLVNTRKTKVDQLAAPGATEAFWQFERERGTRPLAPLTHGETVELRELTATLLHAARSDTAPPVEAVDRANAILAAAPEHSVVRADARTLHVSRTSPADGSAAATRAAALQSLFSDVLDALAGGRLRECAASGCSQLFLASNAKRRWCTAKGCGNRMRVARHANRIQSRAASA
jgi:predicted RNA-binding Zn ribbon-like protein